MRSARPLSKVLLRLYTEDLATLRALATNEAGVNRLAREIIHQFLKKSADAMRVHIDSVGAARRDASGEPNTPQTLEW